MQILSNGVVAIADAVAAHGGTAGGASTDLERAPLVVAGAGAIHKNPDILDPESNA